MNVNTSVAQSYPSPKRSSVTQVPLLSAALSNRKTSDPSVQAHGSDHVSSNTLPKQGLSPLKVVGLHGAVMAVEHGVHFALHKSVRYADRTALSTAPPVGSAKLHTLGDAVGAAAAGYLAYQAIGHALHAASAKNTEATAAYALSAALDAGLAVANTLAVFKRIPSVSMGLSLGVGALSTASAALGAKLEQAKPVSH